MTPDEVEISKVIEVLEEIDEEKLYKIEKQALSSAITLLQELQRLKSREGNAQIELCYDDGKNPFARESLKIVDFGYSDNIYVVESSLLQEYQKLRERVSVEKIASVLYNADKNISGVTEPKQEYMIDAQIIVKYLQQPTEPIER